MLTSPAMPKLMLVKTTTKFTVKEEEHELTCMLSEELLWKDSIVYKKKLYRFCKEALEES